MERSARPSLRRSIPAAALLAIGMSLASPSDAQGSAGGQTPLRLIPEIGLPGDSVRIQARGPEFVYGTNWSISGWDWTLNVGGAIGPFTLAVSGTVGPRVTVNVPGVAFWASPAARVPSNPLGLLEVHSTFADTPMPFYFLEQTRGRVSTIGRASTASNGERGAIWWDLDRGDPHTGNSTFTPRLGLAVPGAIPFLVLSRPVAPPFAPVGDGELVVDLARPLAVVMGPPVGENGDVRVPLPIPSICDIRGPGVTCGIDVHAQWGYIDPVTQQLVVSNGLRFTL